MGYGTAVETVSTVAAPLLAGFAVATIGVVGADSDKFRWPGQTLLCLTFAALLFVTCVQFGFHARQYLYSLADITDWWEEEELRERRDVLREEQDIDFGLWDRWRRRADAAYSGGMVMLWVGVSLVLAPPAAGNPSGVGFRWTAAVVAAGAAVGEAVWSTYPSIRRRIRRHRLLRGSA